MKTPVTVKYLRELLHGKPDEALVFVDDGSCARNLVWGGISEESGIVLRTDSDDGKWIKAERKR